MSTPGYHELAARQHRALDAIIAPSGQSVRRLTEQAVDCLLAASRASAILQTDIPQRTTLEKALQTSPHCDYITIYTGEPGASIQPPKGSPTNQHERWKILETYHRYLEQKPGLFQDFFWRSAIASSAGLMLQEFIDFGVSGLGLKDGTLASSNYLGKLWQETMQQERPEEYARAWAAKQHLPQRESPSSSDIDMQKSTYQLLESILDSVRPPSSTTMPRHDGPSSLTTISRREAERIKNLGESQLEIIEFCALVDSNVVFWKVKSVETSLRGVRYFWVQFLPTADEYSTEEEITMSLEEDDVERQVRVGEDDFLLLVLRSDRC